MINKSQLSFTEKWLAFVNASQQFLTTQPEAIIVALFCLEYHPDHAKELKIVTQTHFKAWHTALQKLFSYQYKATKADELAKITLASIQGVLMLSQLCPEENYSGVLATCLYRILPGSGSKPSTQ